MWTEQPVSETNVYLCPRRTKLGHKGRRHSNCHHYCCCLLSLYRGPGIGLDPLFHYIIYSSWRPSGWESSHHLGHEAAGMKKCSMTCPDPAESKAALGFRQSHFGACTLSIPLPICSPKSEILSAGHARLQGAKARRATLEILNTVLLRPKKGCGEHHGGESTPRAQDSEAEIEIDFVPHPGCQTVLQNLSFYLTQQQGPRFKMKRQWVFRGAQN